LGLSLWNGCREPCFSAQLAIYPVTFPFRAIVPDGTETSSEESDQRCGINGPTDIAEVDPDSGFWPVRGELTLRTLLGFRNKTLSSFSPMHGSIAPCSVHFLLIFSGHLAAASGGVGGMHISAARQ
jgi:hypothetical protein